MFLQLLKVFHVTALPVSIFPKAMDNLFRVTQVAPAVHRQPKIHWLRVGVENIGPQLLEACRLRTVRSQYPGCRPAQILAGAVKHDVSLPEELGLQWYRKKCPSPFSSHGVCSKWEQALIEG